ncbi:MAG: GGDEF domain-containing protein [Spirochaetes bacterium]|jgi:diguanylate cyclase (GGDEF)-like protein|nr:GGDEF domain-containing protein [Spirochaetota bacterium]
MQTRDFLKKVEIFSLLTPEETEWIVTLFRERNYKKNSLLFKEGDRGNELFIIRSGSVASYILTPDGMDREIAKFAEGNFFGEMSIFENAPRSATCRAVNDSLLMSLQDDDFYRIIEEKPDIAVKIMYRMLNITTQRLRDTGEFLSEMVHWGEAASKRIITDDLTGIYNRRFLDDALESFFESQKKEKKQMSLIMIDLDRFRDVNEMYGNEAGDKMILAVVNVYKQYLREKDIFARYGGDEFTIILPDTTLSASVDLAEKIRVQVSKEDVLKRYGGEIKNVTVSQGISNFPDSAADLKVLKEKADQALYRAKLEGRNRVVTN